MKSEVIRRIVTAAMLAALTFAATAFFRIPSPLNGYLNLGDGVVLLAGWLLPPAYGFLAAGIGSALADLSAGYLVYAPATFVIKGCMALLAGCLFRWRCRTRNDLAAPLISGTVAEIIMILGYFVFEGFLYGFIPSLVNIPANAVQGIAGLVIATVAIRVLNNRHTTLS